MDSLQEKLNINIITNLPDEILNKMIIKILEQYIIKYVLLLLISLIFNPLLFFLSNFYFLRNLPSNIQNYLFILNVIALLIYTFFCAICAIKYHKLQIYLINPDLFFIVNVCFIIIQVLLSSIMDKCEMHNAAFFTAMLFIIQVVCVMYYVELDLNFEKDKRILLYNIKQLCSQSIY